MSEKKGQKQFNTNYDDTSGRRTSLLSSKEKTVVFGILYGLLAIGFTMIMDLLPVPEKESMLWLMMAGVYLLFLVISAVLEYVYNRKKLPITRTLYYLSAQLLMLVAIIVLIVLGVRSDVPLEFNSYFSYALAFSLTEIVILFYHLGRFVVRCIMGKNK